MKKRALSVCLALCMVLSLLPGTAMAAEIIDSGECGAEGDNFTWTLDADGLLTISGTGEMGHYHAPADPTDEPVLIPWYNYRDSIVTVAIESGVTKIGNEAFSGCENLESVTIANSVTVIDLCAFSNCLSLKSVTMSNSINSIGDLAFINCTRLTSIMIPNSVTSIGESAFENCALTSIIIPDGVTSISGFAFNGCENMTNVVIPNSVTSIGKHAFSACDSLSEVSYEGTMAQWGVIDIVKTDVFEGNEYESNKSLLDATIHCTDGDIYNYTYKIMSPLGNWNEEVGYYVVDSFNDWDYNDWDFTIDAPVDEITDLYINGEKLSNKPNLDPEAAYTDPDYIVGSNSGDRGTQITISGSYFFFSGTGFKTIAVEFTMESGEIRRVSQNFAILPIDPVALSDGYVDMSYSYD